MNRYRAWSGGFILLMSLALAACGSAAPARSASPGFTGYVWPVVSISHDGKVTSIPGRLHAALQFSPGGQFGANDSVNVHSGTYRATGDGFTTGALSSTSAGYAGHDPAVLLTVSAIGSFDAGVHTAVELTASRLTVSVGSYTLACERRGPQADIPAPAGDPGPEMGRSAG